VAGQKHVSRTFRNALKDNKITHAYMFSGPRGTGKTSVAKIIANTVNCLEYPISEPCGVCENCLSIEKGMFTDIIEIDAASNNGVDEIREIRDKVKYTPSQGKYKVYIIDEVHMLSIGAFNALLKTLEEPPAHVIFILATTEPHKIPATIHSRCQRFDFKEISIKDIKVKVKEIIDKESIHVNLEALDAIAEAAEGGMRDALSLLDQALSYSDDRVTEADVHAVAGTVSDVKIIELFRYVVKSDVVKALSILNNLIEEGKEVNRISSQMIIFLKDVLMFKNVKGEQFHKAIYNKEQFIELAKELSNDQIFFYVDSLSGSQREMKMSNNPRTYLEITVLKMADSIGQREAGLSKRLDEIEEKMKNHQPVKVAEKPVVVRKTEEPVFEDTEEENVFEEKVKPMTSVEIYDVERISDVLNNAMHNKARSKELKQELVDHWNKINIKAEPNVFAVAQDFSNGTIVASWESDFLITFPSVDVVNKLMRSDVRKKLGRLLKSVYGRDRNYIAMPIELWNMKRKEYFDQSAIGNAPKLSKIEFEGLILVEEKAEEPDIVKEAVDIFGEDMINLK
jgi:DNA polymerase-3 subunit gamma/tau